MNLGYNCNHYNELDGIRLDPWVIILKISDSLYALYSV